MAKNTVRLTILSNSKSASGATAKTVELTRGANLLDSINAAGMPIGSSCGAVAVCAKCGVQIVKGGENLSKPSEAEKKLITRDKLSNEIRLACITKVMGDVTITTGYW